MTLLMLDTAVKAEVARMFDALDAVGGGAGAAEAAATLAELRKRWL